MDTKHLDLLQKKLEMGNKYLEQNNYYSAISEFTKIVDSLSDEAEKAKKDSHPPIVIALHLQILSQALIARQMCYLSIGEKKKAQSDAELFDEVHNVINKIQMQSKNALEEKKDDGSSLGGCLTVIIFIFFIYKWLTS